MSRVQSSSINWLTFKPEDVQQAREILKDLGPDSTVDSIGLGLPVEEISNILFPGTSTLHTRLRYQLFIAGIIYKMYSEAAHRPLKNPKKRLYVLELNLMNTLLAVGEKEGVIGRTSKEGLKAWPSQTYWGAINTLKLLAAEPVSRFDILSELGAKSTLKIINDDGENEGRDRKVIDPDPALMKISKNMFKGDLFQSSTEFGLTRFESEYLLNKLEATQIGRESLLFYWARQPKKRFSSFRSVLDCPNTKIEKLDTLIFEAKNYSRMAMGISHAYRYALCAHKASKSLGERQAEWDTHAAKNIENLGEWLKTHGDLKGWKVQNLDSAIKLFADTSKVDINLIKMVDTFNGIWGTTSKAKKFVGLFSSEVIQQEKFRRGNRSHFEDSLMTIPENTKGEQGNMNWLYDYRSKQGYSNAWDIAEGLRGSK